MKYALILPLLMCSCSFLQIAPLQVEGWTPEDFLLETLEGVSITLTFSEVPDRIRTEQALQVLENGKSFYGKFEWIDDYTIKFKPYEPLKQDQLYTIEAGTGCEDIYGNSLEQPFLHRFSTSSDRTRPEVVGATPKDGETIFERAVPISVTFSEAMDWGTLLKSISVSPNLPGSSTISSDLRTFTFTPSALFDWGVEYIITVSDEAADCSGNTLGRKFISRFTLGDDTAVPEILSVTNGSGVFLLPDAPGSQNITSGWETTWKLSVSFSEPVLRDELASRVEFIPHLSFSFDGMSVTKSSEVIISPDAPFTHATLYQLIISSGYIDEQENEGLGSSYYFLVDGPRTKPPEISRLTFLQDWADNPGSITDLYRPDGSGGYTSSLEIDVSAYDSGPPVYDKGFFDIYLILADKANQDWDLLRLNLIRNFRIRAGNNCAEIFPLAFELFPSDPNPVPGPDETVVRIHTEIFDMVESGIIELSLDSYFTDGLDLPIPQPWILRLNK